MMRPRWVDNDDGWTTVTYRRGRGRTQQQFWDRGAGGRRGMDRARPVSWTRRRVQSPPPNRPVPPAGRFSRYPGPQYRTYASVVSQTNPNFVPRRGPRFQGPPANQDQRRQPADPEFGKLVRQLHSIIKMVHHLQNVTPKPDSPQPRMIARMVDILADMIKPARPTANTMDMIEGNAKNWGYNTLLILEEHYKAGLETLLADLVGDLGPNWRTAFQVAVKWARKNLPRITQEVIDYAEALITAGRVEDGPTEGVQQPQPPTEVAQPPAEATQEPAVVAQSSPQVAVSQPKVYNTVATNTEAAREWSPDLRTTDYQQEEPLIQLPLQETPKQQRVRRGRMESTGCVLSDLSLVENIEEEGREESPPVIHSSWDNLDFSIFDDDEDVNRDGTPTLAPRTAVPVTKKGPGVGQQVVAQVHRDDSQGESLVHTPEQRVARVTRHISTDRKMVDWGLSVSKKWLIIGDSNLSRIPSFSVPDLQIDSYPGANFRHAQAILGKAISHVQVEKVVLSFGLNSRAQNVKATTVKQLQAAFRTAKKAFPHAELWIPLVNFSTSLPGKEREGLRLLNGHLERNMPFIPLLPEDEFQTEKDHVHWTSQTAKAMLRHWAKCLNL